METIQTPESSTIVTFGYDAGRSVLMVEFKHGTRYEYYDVPSHVFEQMKQAPSKGSYLAHTIKGNFRYARV